MYGLRTPACSITPVLTITWVRLPCLPSGSMALGKMQESKVQSLNIKIKELTGEDASILVKYAAIAFVVARLVAP